MIKHGSSNVQASSSSKHNKNIRMGGSKGNHSAKGIKHGAGGRQLSETEHSERMGHECGDGYSS
jgi:hypothetical protein